MLILLFSIVRNVITNQCLKSQVSVTYAIGYGQPTLLDTDDYEDHEDHDDHDDHDEHNHHDGNDDHDHDDHENG